MQGLRSQFDVDNMSLYPHILRNIAFKMRRLIVIFLRIL